MALFEMSVVCNQCGAQFVVDDCCLVSVREGDYEVQYFSCPDCGARHQIFTSDSEMRKLIERRKVVQTQIRAAFAKKFREKTIRSYERELEKIKREQKKRMPRLKAAGEKILAEVK